MNIPAWLEDRIQIWRLVDKMRVSLIEIERDWTLCDVLEANTYLDISEDIDYVISKSRK